MRANRESIPQHRKPSAMAPSAPATSSRVSVAGSGYAVRPRPWAAKYRASPIPRNAYVGPTRTK
jgi:hypothetical protein